jgi:hypothetical protein
MQTPATTHSCYCMNVCSSLKSLLLHISADTARHIHAAAQILACYSVHIYAQTAYYFKLLYKFLLLHIPATAHIICYCTFLLLVNKSVASTEISVAAQTPTDAHSCCCTNFWHCIVLLLLHK